MGPEPETAAGSPLWQAIFFSFAIVLILFEVARGWRNPDIVNVVVSLGKSGRLLPIGTGEQAKDDTGINL